MGANQYPFKNFIFYYLIVEIGKISLVDIFYDVKIIIITLYCT